MNQLLNWKGNMLVQIFKNYVLRIILAALVVTGLGILGASYLKQQTYISSGQLVQNDSNYSMISSYNQLITSTVFKSEMKKKINQSRWKNSVDEYKISLDSSANSPFFSVNTISRNPSYAQFVSEQSMNILVEDAPKYLSGANLSIVFADRSAKSVSRKSFLATLGIFVFIISFILLYAYVILTVVFGGRIKDSSYLEDVVGIKQLGEMDLKNK